MALAKPESFLKKYAVKTENVRKADLVARLRGLQEGKAVSWFLAGTRFFGWAEINMDRDEFIDEIQKMDFRSARMSVHVPGRGSRYSMYRVTG